MHTLSSPMRAFPYLKCCVLQNKRWVWALVHLFTIFTLFVAMSVDMEFLQWSSFLLSFLSHVSVSDGDWDYVGEFKVALGIWKQLALASKFFLWKFQHFWAESKCSENFLRKISFMCFPSFIELGSFNSLIIMLIASSIMTIFECIGKLVQ